ncbi:MAG: hypothetical protein ACW986_15650 [Promethearchaeota archaeon]|jgi:hypothetical protein
MCAKFRGVPALIYSGLWRRQIFGKLKKDFPEDLKLVVYITDHPPAVFIKIEDGNFEMEKLEKVKDLSDIDKIECDGYFAGPEGYLYGGFPTLKRGLEEGKVKMKNESKIFNIILRNL